MPDKFERMKNIQSLSGEIETEILAMLDGKSSVEVSELARIFSVVKMNLLAKEASHKDAQNILVFPNKNLFTHSVEENLH